MHAFQDACLLRILAYHPTWPDFESSPTTPPCRLRQLGKRTNFPLGHFSNFPLGPILPNLNSDPVLLSLQAIVGLPQRHRLQAVGEWGGSECELELSVLPADPPRALAYATPLILVAGGLPKLPPLPPESKKRAQGVKGHREPPLLKGPA